MARPKKNTTNESVATVPPDEQLSRIDLCLPTHRAQSLDPASLLKKATVRRRQSGRDVADLSLAKLTQTEAELVLKGLERGRKLALLESSNLGELPYVEEMLTRLGEDYDQVDLKLALAEMFRRGWAACDNRTLDKALEGLPANATGAQVLRRLRIQMREDRSVPSPTAVATMRRALKDGTFRSMRHLADFAVLNEATIRKVIKNERADLPTWRKIATALNVPLKTLLEG
jgi:hypothetical protein